MLDLSAVGLDPEGYWRLTWYERVPSTNDLAAGAALLGASEGLVVGAETQEAGRGRWGRRWADAPGRCLLFSLLLGSPDEDSFPWLGAAAALAAVRAAGDAGAASLGFRWPNDVVWADHKVAGLLVERAGERAVVGIGINARGRGEDLAPGCAAATVEEAAGRAVSREALLAGVLAHLRDLCGREGRCDRASLRAALAGHDALAGREVTLRTQGREVSGRAAGLDERCRLILQTPAGTMSLSQGEVVKVEG